ncbi:hypothetical protein QAD02_008029 [Eretmocerus hayati]|uniref:Uncharacterized protein n=1 Tax=Eretmocerus hayati TaxID=131215 RepID=A0ACC2N5L8_9HYME|nr:hypothetical protein QAD02_008029 [Eretmocerus hayati]
MDQSGTVRPARFGNLSYNVGVMGNEGVERVFNQSSISHSQSNSDTITSDPTTILRHMSTTSVNLVHSGDDDTSTINMQRGIKRASDECCYDDSVHDSQQIMHPQNQSLTLPRECSNDNAGESYSSGNQMKKSPPSNGKKTKGRVKIKMEYIDNKLRRYTTFSKRKTGIMKKVCQISNSYRYELLSMENNLVAT